MKLSFLTTVNNNFPDYLNQQNGKEKNDNMSKNRHQDQTVVDWIQFHIKLS